jgi:hypothetical protein
VLSLVCTEIAGAVPTEGSLQVLESEVRASRNDEECPYPVDGRCPYAGTGRYHPLICREDKRATVGHDTGASRRGSPKDRLRILQAALSEGSLTVRQALGWGFERKCP